MPAHPTDQDTISDRDFYRLAHPLHNPRYHLAVVFAALLFPAMAIIAVVGTIFLVIPLLALLQWFFMRVSFAYLIGNVVFVSPINYPRIYDLTEEMKLKIGYPKKIHIFVFQNSAFNAFMSVLFFRRAIFLNSELLENGVSDDEVRWLVGRFVGYLRARRQAGVLGWLVRVASHTGIFTLFMLPYDRAMVYTGDRLALAAIRGDVSSAVSAMQKILVGRQLGYSLNPEGIVEQQRLIKGSFFGFLARLLSGFPHLTTRFVDLIVFARAAYPDRYAAFAAANPGLPTDLPQLAACARSALRPEDAVGSGKPHGWPWALGTTAALALLVLVTVSTVLRPPQPPASPYTPTPVYAPTPSPQPAAPPHTHLAPNGGGYTPDAGCAWVSNDPNDLRVKCR